VRGGSAAYNRADMTILGTGGLRFVKASDQSLLIYFDDEKTVEANRRMAKLVRALESSPIVGVRNLHPAFRSMLVVFDGLRWTHEQLQDELRMRAQDVREEIASEARTVEVPVCYGGELGPDLEDVAQLHGMTAEQVISLHAGRDYSVFFLGFVPGFAYMGDLAPELVTPRLASPRKVVPAGSVGIAGRQTGVYPFATPGGWRLLGRTPLKMFQKERGGMSLLRLGDRVKFVAISRERFVELENA
jgi:KipI family sensor histidine kinase inhibitor